MGGCGRESEWDWREVGWRQERRMVGDEREVEGKMREDIQRETTAGMSLNNDLHIQYRQTDVREREWGALTFSWTNPDRLLSTPAVGVTTQSDCCHTIKLATVIAHDRHIWTTMCLVAVALWQLKQLTGQNCRVGGGGGTVVRVPLLQKQINLHPSLLVRHQTALTHHTLTVFHTFSCAAAAHKIVREQLLVVVCLVGTN